MFAQSKLKYPRCKIEGTALLIILNTKHNDCKICTADLWFVAVANVKNTPWNLNVCKIYGEAESHKVNKWITIFSIFYLVRQILSHKLHLHARYDFIKQFCLLYSHFAVETACWWGTNYILSWCTATQYRWDLLTLSRSLMPSPVPNKGAFPSPSRRLPGTQHNWILASVGPLAWL